MMPWLGADEAWDQARLERYHETEPESADSRFLHEQRLCPLPYEQRTSDATRRGKARMMGFDPDMVFADRRYLNDRPVSAQEPDTDENWREAA